jgi:hypothetical protein
MLAAVSQGWVGNQALLRLDGDVVGLIRPGRAGSLQQDPGVASDTAPRSRIAQRREEEWKRSLVSRGVTASPAIGRDRRKPCTLSQLSFSTDASWAAVSDAFSHNVQS